MPDERSDVGVPGEDRPPFFGVLLGRITAKRYGFYDADPGQLFQVEPIRSCGQRLTKPRFYFFMPVGRFQFAGVDICKTDDRYAEPPNIGDEAFLFVLPPSDDDGVLFHVLDAGDIVPVAADGSLRLPLQYAAQDQGAAKRSAVAPTKSDLLARRSSRSSWCSSM